MKARFDALKQVASLDLKSEEVTAGLLSLVDACLDFLEKCPREKLNSEVPGKSYFVFRTLDGKKSSRPVNANLFDHELTKAHMGQVLGVNISGLCKEGLARVLYSAAMAYCCGIDLTKERDQKTPGTFFEIMVGHLVACTYGVNPETKVSISSMGMEQTLPTDFVFNLGEGKSRIHLPVKTSTRERVVQVWAHQRVLDGIAGVNRFRGILTCINETNQKSKTNSVVEICLPDQWVIYQMYIAQLHRVYYLDRPVKYASLFKTYPFIQVKNFADFFGEAETLVSTPPT